MDTHALFKGIRGIQKFVVIDSRSDEKAQTEMNLYNPQIMVNYLGQNILSQGFDQDSFKFPFLTHVNDQEALSKFVTVQLYDDNQEIGSMKLKMQTLMLMGVKQGSFGSADKLMKGITAEKSTWFPIFKDNKCTG